MRIRAVLLSLALLPFCSGCTGLRPDSVTAPTQSEALTLLASGQFAELDQRYGAIQQAYKTGQFSDEDLRAAFRVFYVTDAALAPKYDAWVQHSPKSYAAHLAKGIYFKKLGMERRGTDFISNTSEEQIRGMQAAYEIAGKELEASQTLDDRPLLTYLHSIDLYMEDGDKAGARRQLDLAVAIAPHNYIVREKYMGSLQTRWGGSVDEMQAFLAECRNANLSEAHLRTLEALVIEDEGWTHEYRDGDMKAAIRAYLKAAQLNPSSNCSPCGPLNRAADAMLSEKDYEGARELFSKILDVDPTSIHALESRGFIEIHLQDMQAARVDLLKAADQGDAYAQDMLGRTYLVAGPDRDPNRAAEWLQKAADQGYLPSKQILPFVLREQNGKASPSAPP